MSHNFPNIFDIFLNKRNAPITLSKAMGASSFSYRLISHNLLGNLFLWNILYHNFMNISTVFTAFHNVYEKIWHRRFSPMPDLLFFRILLYFHRESCSELEGILEDGCFGEAHVLAPAIVELFEGFFLLVREALFEFLVMPCHIAEEFFHLRWVGSAIFLRNYVSVP